MSKLFRIIEKYWVVISAVATLLVSIFTYGLKLKGMIDKSNATTIEMKKEIKALRTEVDEHDNDLDSLDRRVVPLEKVEELREKGLMK